MARNRVAILIEMANIQSAFNRILRERNLDQKFRIDYSKLVNRVATGSKIVSKKIYMETSKDHEIIQLPFLKYLEKIGFQIISKEKKVIRLDNGDNKIKVNFDVEITADICDHLWQNDCDEIILVSGDSDFLCLLKKAEEKGIIFTVVSSIDSVSSELSSNANKVINIDEIFDDILFERKVIVNDRVAQNQA